MLDDFIQANTGKLVSFDGVVEHAGDNMQLIAAWCKHIGLPFRWPAPKDWYVERSDDAFADYWKIYYAGDISVVPCPGDIIIFEDTMPGTDGTGHASIFVEWSGGNWIGFDADWEGEVAHLQEHNWLFVHSWVTPIEPLSDRLPVNNTESHRPKSGLSNIAPPVWVGDSQDKQLISKPIPQYRSMSDAIIGRNSVGPIECHNYFVYRRLNGMMHLTMVLGQPSGIWINPADLEPKPVPIPPEVVNAPVDVIGWHPSVILEGATITPDLSPLSPTLHRVAEVDAHYGKLVAKVLKFSQVMKAIKEKHKELK